MVRRKNRAFCILLSPPLQNKSRVCFSELQQTCYFKSFLRFCIQHWSVLPSFQPGKTQMGLGNLPEAFEKRSSSVSRFNGSFTPCRTWDTSAYVYSACLLFFSLKAGCVGEGMKRTAFSSAFTCNNSSCCSLCRLPPFSSFQPSPAPFSHCALEQHLHPKTAAGPKGKRWLCAEDMEQLLESSYREIPAIVLKYEVSSVRGIKRISSQ